MKGINHIRMKCMTIFRKGFAGVFLLLLLALIIDITTRKSDLSLYVQSSVAAIITDSHDSFLSGGNTTTPPAPFYYRSGNFPVQGFGGKYFISSRLVPSKIFLPSGEYYSNSGEGRKLAAAKYIAHCALLI